MEDENYMISIPANVKLRMEIINRYRIKRTYTNNSSRYSLSYFSCNY